MKPFQALRDESGTAAIEFGLTAPLYFMLLLGLISGAMLLWVQVGLQHGTEMAARCATVDKVICGNVNDIKNFASQQTLGLSPSPSVFTVTTAECGNLVSASYPLPNIGGNYGIQLFNVSAQACFPK